MTGARGAATGPAPRARRAILTALALTAVLHGPAAAASDPAAAVAAGPAATGSPGGVRLEARVDRQAITIGDPITLTLALSYPEGTRISDFTPETALDTLALLDRRSEPPATMPDGRRLEKRILKLTVYDLGQFEIPAFEAAYEDASGRPGRAASTPIPFSVASVLAAEDQRPADIKKPAEMPELVLWPFVLAALAVLVAGLAYWWRRRRRVAPSKAEAPSGPPEPADEQAYAELGRLLSSGLLERGEVKAFYVELSEILRRYVGARFGVDTFECTTSEILEALRVARLPLRSYTATAEFFGACDLVKFAKYVPGADETRATVERAYRLIDETRPPRAEPAAAVAEAAGARAAGGAS